MRGEVNIREGEDDRLSSSKEPLLELGGLGDPPTDLGDDIPKLEALITVEPRLFPILTLSRGFLFFLMLPPGDCSTAERDRESEEREKRKRERESKRDIHILDRS